MVKLSAATDANGDSLATAAGLGQRQHELLEQFRGLVQWRPLAALLGDARDLRANEQDPSSGYDAAFDSRLDADQLYPPEIDKDRHQLVTLVCKGLRHRSALPLLASYGEAATMHLDFVSGQVTIDALALQRLRLARELPYLTQSRAVQAEAQVLELDLVMWGSGLASHALRLLNAPVHWWHTPLVTPQHASVARNTRAPKHLEMVRMFLAARITPAELRTQARVSLAQLRAFLQACPFVGLVYSVRTPDAECHIKDRGQGAIRECCSRI